MEVIDPRSALLSNYEVLTLLQELDREQTARAKANFLVKKEQTDQQQRAHAALQPEEEIAENLKTIEYEAIQYLTADYQPIKKQTERGIQNLTKQLRKYELTKAEKLQIVNLAPTETVDLYVIVEEIEDRFPDSMDEILSVVRSSLSDDGQRSISNDIGTFDLPTELAYPPTNEDIPLFHDDDGMFEEAMNHEEMVDERDAGGFEGDLEMGDEED